MNDENTIYDDENTQYQSQEQQTTEQQSADRTNASNATKKTRPAWQRVAAGAGAGFAMGAGATILSSSTPAEETGEENNNEVTVEEVNTTDGHQAYVDGEVHVATSVNDNMSFGEAFQAARAELGAGGVFEWHGQLYNTYYAEEWNQMSPEQHDEFASHIDNSEHHSTYVAQTHDDTQDDINVISVNTPNGGQSGMTNDENVIPVTVVDEEPQVEVLGVIHDDETGANVGGMIIDGHEAVVLDVDGNMEFEILGVDVNDNHQFEENELADISEEGLTVDDLGGFTPTDDTMTTDANIDCDPVSYDC